MRKSNLHMMFSTRTAFFGILFGGTCIIFAQANIDLPGIQMADLCLVLDEEAGDFNAVQAIEDHVDALLRAHPGSMEGVCDDHCDTLCSDKDLCTVDYDTDLGCESNGCFDDASRFTVDCNDGFSCVSCPFGSILLLLRLLLLFQLVSHCITVYILSPSKDY